MSRSPSVTPIVGRTGAWGAIGLVAGAVLAAGSAQAQSASGTLSSYRTGYGGAGLSGLISPVSPSLISSGSQYSISDGVNQAGAVGSVIATPSSNSSTSGGAGQSSTGVGQAAVSAARAPLAVVERSDGTAASAKSAEGAAPEALVLNGKLNLDGGQ